jgi:hypothetical protein
LNAASVRRKAFDRDDFRFRRFHRHFFLAAGPFRRAFNDQIGEDIGPLITRKLGCDVQMGGPPVPPLRHDSIDACAKPAVPIAVWEQNAELCGDAGTGLILKCAWANDVLEEGK